MALHENISQSSYFIGDIHTQDLDQGLLRLIGNSQTWQNPVDMRDTYKYGRICNADPKYYDKILATAREFSVSHVQTPQQVEEIANILLLTEASRLNGIGSKVDNMTNLNDPNIWYSNDGIRKVEADTPPSNWLIILDEEEKVVNGIQSIELRCNSSFSALPQLAKAIHTVQTQPGYRLLVAPRDSQTNC